MTLESSMPSAYKRLRTLDGLRGILAVYIVLFHMLFERLAGLDLFFPLAFGRWGVQIFLALSGYCLMLSMLHRQETGKVQSYGQFLLRRAGRLLPPYYIGLVVSLLCIFTLIGTQTGTTWDKSLPVTFGAFLQSVFLVNNMTTHMFTINHSYWFIPYLFQFTVLFPLLFALLRATGRAGFFCITVAFALIVAFSISPVEPFSNYRFISFFCFGMLTADAARSVHWQRLFSSIFSLLAIPLLSFIYFYSILSFGNQAYVANIFGDLIWAAIVSFAFAVFRAQGQNPFVRILEHPVFLYLGTISYSLYLVHAVIIAILTRLILYPLGLTPVATFLLLVGIGLPCSIVAAHFFYVLFERPFVRGFSADHLQKFYTEPISLRISVTKDTSAQ